ncbi:MAG: c-type cytochrome [Acidobacteriota bacterium]|nr:c-type cytochrome [Acidobacteriota bacterium]
MWNRIPAVLMLAIIVSRAQVVKPRNPLGDGLEVVAAGRTIYNKTCTMCHGQDGADGDRAPSLSAARRYFRLSDASIFDAIKNGIPGSAMPAAGLPDNDVWRIVAFVRNIRSTASDNIVPGDVEHGMRVFESKGGCQKCHMIRGQGGIMGPDLSSIGAELTLSRLRDSLTKAVPIRPGFQTVLATTRTGEVIRGIAKNEDGFSIEILDEKGKLHLFTKDELREVVHEKTSAMPHDIDKKLTADEFRDLVAMLSRQARTKVRVEQQGESEIGR